MDDKEFYREFRWARSISEEFLGEMRLRDAGNYMARRSDSAGGYEYFNVFPTLGRVDLKSPLTCAVHVFNSVSSPQGMRASKRLETMYLNEDRLKTLERIEEPIGVSYIEILDLR